MMKRKSFIKNSSILLGGLSLFPTVLKAIDLRESQFADLNINQHIRHGFYGKDCVINEINGSVLENLRIDRFMNPEGDMLLIDCDTRYGKLRISAINNEIVYEFNEEIKSLENSNHSATLPLAHNKIQLLVNPDPSLLHSTTYREGIVLLDESPSCHYFNSGEMLTSINEKMKLVVFFV